MGIINNVPLPAPDSCLLRRSRSDLVRSTIERKRIEAH
jgi:hypothetical protein